MRKLLEFEDELIDAAAMMGRVGRRFVEERIRVQAKRERQRHVFSCATELRRHVVLETLQSNLLEFETQHDSMVDSSRRVCSRSGKATFSPTVMEPKSAPP